MANSKLPKADMIFAGFLANISLSTIIIEVTDDGYLGWTSSDFCHQNGIPWLLLIIISAGVAIVTFLKSKEEKAVQGIISFVASFLLNCSGGYLGYMAMYCSRYSDFYYDHYYYDYSEVFSFDNIYSYCSIAVMILVSIGIIAHYLFNFKVIQQATRIPDPEVMLLGVCINFAISNIIYSSGGLNYMCKISGIGSWLILLALSVILAGVTLMKTTENFKILRSAITFISTFLLQLIAGGTGHIAIGCAIYGDPYNLAVAPYRYPVMVLNALLALAIMIRFLLATPPDDNPPERPGMVIQNAVLNAPPDQPPNSYPMQPTDPVPSYPPQAYYPQQAYHPPHAFHPQRSPYTQQGSDPPQAFYRQKGHNLLQGSVPQKSSDPQQASSPAQTANPQ